MVIFIIVIIEVWVICCIYCGLNTFPFHNNQCNHGVEICFLFIWVASSKGFIGSNSQCTHLVVLSRLFRVALPVKPLRSFTLSPKNINVLTGSTCLATPWSKVHLIIGSYMHDGKRHNICSHPATFLILSWVIRQLPPSSELLSLPPAEGEEYHVLWYHISLHSLPYVWACRHPQMTRLTWYSQPQLMVISSGFQPIISGQ